MINTDVRRGARAATAALLLVFLSTLVPPAAAPDSVLTILHFSDDYQLTPRDAGKSGGLDRLASLVKQFRRERYSLLLFAGGMLSPSAESSVFKGRQMIDGLNHLGVDAAVFGNHEFDLGPAELERRLAESHFPWVATNTFGPGQTPFPRSRPYLILPVAGTQIGILGLTTPDTETSSSPGSTTFGDPVAVAKATIPIMRGRGARVIIALTHLDIGADRELLRSVPDIDLVIGGYDASPVTARVDGRLIAKAGAYGRWLGVTRVPLKSARDARHIVVPVTDATPSDPEMAAVVKGYIGRLGVDLDVDIGETRVPLDARDVLLRQQEAPLGDFIADAMRASVHADIGITNGGGIRTNGILAAGPIRRRTVLAWLPFGNVVVKVAVPGRTVREMLENGVSQVDQLGGRFPQVSGIRFSFDPTRPPGLRVLNVRVRGRPLDPAALYTVAANDFMLRGGDGYGMLTKGMVMVEPAAGPAMSAVVIEAIRRAGAIRPTSEGRITVGR